MILETIMLINSINNGIIIKIEFNCINFIIELSVSNSFKMNLRFVSTTNKTTREHCNP